MSAQENEEEKQNFNNKIKIKEKMSKYKEIPDNKRNNDLEKKKSSKNNEILKEITPNNYRNLISNSKEVVNGDFVRNSKILLSRYELFHLCIAEIIYSSKDNQFVSIQTLKKISKIHEQLFKTGLKYFNQSIDSIESNDLSFIPFQKNNKDTVNSGLEEIKCDLPVSFLSKFSKKQKTKRLNLYFLLSWSFYNYLPILTWFPQYKINQFLKNDLVAGTTVGVMLIAQGMAYAKLAGLAPEYGLYSSGIPLLIYPFFGTSRHLGIGPVALVSLLVSQVTLSTNNAGYDYSATEKTSFALLMAFCVGFFQILMGLFHIGFIINFISHPVIAGFTTAAAFVIILSQLQHILGYPVSKSHYPFLTFFSYIVNLGKFKWQPCLFGFVNIFFMQLAKQINRIYKLEIPGPIVCVIGSIIITQVFRLDRFGISIQKDIPKGFPKLRGPIFNEFTKVAPTVITISFINFLETVAIASKIGEVHGYKIVPDQELIGSGMTNLLGSFLCAFPMAGSFSRTAVLSQLGAKTQIAGMITGLVIILTYLFLTPLFRFLPNVTLASIILVSVVNLVDYNEAIHLFRIRFLDFFAFMISLISTFMIGVEWGMAIAVGVSLIFVLWFSVKPPICTLGRIRGTVVYRDIKWYEKCIRTPGGVLLRMDAPLFFVNAAVLRKKIRQKEDEYFRKNPVPLFYVIIDCRGMTDIDSTGLQVLNELAEKYEKQGVFLGFSNANERVKNLVQMGRKPIIIKESRFFTRIHDGIESAIRWKFFHIKNSVV